MSTEDTMSPTERLAAAPLSPEEEARMRAIVEAMGFDGMDDWDNLSVARLLATLDADRATPRLTPAPSPDALRLDRSLVSSLISFALAAPTNEASAEARDRVVAAARAALATPAEPPAAPPTLDGTTRGRWVARETHVYAETPNWPAFDPRSGYVVPAAALVADTETEADARLIAEMHAALRAALATPAEPPAGPKENTMADLPFPTTDASQWASEFVRLHGGDEGLMLAWFANAIEHGRGPAAEPPAAPPTLDAGGIRLPWASGGNDYDWKRAEGIEDPRP